MADPAVIKSPHKRLAKMETLARTIMFWAESDVKNGPKHRKLLVPRDVVRACEAALHED